MCDQTPGPKIEVLHIHKFGELSVENQVTFFEIVEIHRNHASLLSGLARTGQTHCRYSRLKIGHRSFVIFRAEYFVEKH